MEKINDEETVGKSFKKSSYHLININSLVLSRTARFHPMRCHEKKWYETCCFICVKKKFQHLSSFSASLGSFSWLINGLLLLFIINQADQNIFIFSLKYFQFDSETLRR